MLATLLAVTMAQAPVVVELFSSEGCSSCPQAERALAALEVPGFEVLALERHVDYWNSIGWVDPFSTAEATQAQQRGDSLRGWGVYTPQLIVDGASAFSSGAKLPKVVAAAAKKPVLSVTATLKGRVIEATLTDPVKAARIELFLVEAKLVSHVTSGENAGETLAHAPVVRATRLAQNAKASFELDPKYKVANLAVVAAARDSEAGPITAAGRGALRGSTSSP